MLTRQDALARGFMIDHHAPGRPVAFKGPRYAPTAVEGVYTAHEQALRLIVTAIANLPPDAPAARWQTLAQSALALEPHTDPESWDRRR